MRVLLIVWATIRRLVDSESRFLSTRSPPTLSWSSTVSLLFLVVWDIVTDKNLASFRLEVPLSPYPPARKPSAAYRLVRQFIDRCASCFGRRTDCARLFRNVIVPSERSNQEPLQLAPVTSRHPHSPFLR